MNKLTTEQYIQKAKKIHGDKYDYSSSVYSGSQKKINIFCLKCKSFFSQKADRHLKGYNCNNCSKGGGGIKFTLQDFIKKSVERHGNRYNYDLVVYKNSLTYVKIICNTCNKIFEQIPNSHWAGNGCPYQCCLRGPKLNKRAEKFLLEVKRIHGNKYDFSVINYTKDRNEISVKNNICGHKFEILPKSFLQLKQCRVCYELNKQKDRYERFVARARQIHGDDYDYSIGNYINYNTRFEVLHKICNKTFYLLPQNHIHYESGCPHCFAPRARTTEEFINEAKEKHKDKFNYDKVIYLTSITKIKITCNTCNIEFEQTPSQHLNNKFPCINCFLESVTKTTNQFIEESKLLYGNKFCYDKTNYINSYSDIDLYCNDCGTHFKQNVRSHFQGVGCRVCTPKGISKSSQRWLDYLGIPKDIGIYREVKIKLPNMKKYFTADGFDPTTNTIYEFHGDYWHGNPKIYDPDDINKVNNKTFGKLFEQTTKRSQKLRNAGYNLVSIWESEWNEIEKNLLLKQSA